MNKVTRFPIEFIKSPSGTNPKCSKFIFKNCIDRIMNNTFIICTIIPYTNKFTCVPIKFVKTVMSSNPENITFIFQDRRNIIAPFSARSGSMWGEMDKCFVYPIKFIQSALSTNPKISFFILIESVNRSISNSVGISWFIFIYFKIVTIISIESTQSTKP